MKESRRIEIERRLITIDSEIAEAKRKIAKLKTSIAFTEVTIAELEAAKAKLKLEVYDDTIPSITISPIFDTHPETEDKLQPSFCDESYKGSINPF